VIELPFGVSSTGWNFTFFWVSRIASRNFCKRKTITWDNNKKAGHFLNSFWVIA
jgi:hypothetical protein